MKRGKREEAPQGLCPTALPALLPSVLGAGWPRGGVPGAGVESQLGPS